MNLLENTADFVSSQLSSGSTDPGVLQDVGASLLHGISNVITAASTGAQQDEEEEEESDESEDSEKETEKEKKKAAKGQVLTYIRVAEPHNQDWAIFPALVYSLSPARKWCYFSYLAMLKGFCK